MKKPKGLVARTAATEKTLDRFRFRAFDWSNGTTCIQLARTHLKNMGHAVPMVPRFTTPIGAKRALEATGFKDLAALLDDRLERVAPAAMWVGDVAVLPGDPESGGQFFDSIAIAAGNGVLLGWHGDDLSRMHNMVEVDHSAIIGAWRV